MKKKIFYFIAIITLVAFIQVPYLSKAISENFIIFKDDIIIINDNGTYTVISENLRGLDKTLSDYNINKIHNLIINDKTNVTAEIENIFSLNKLVKINDKLVIEPSNTGTFISYKQGNTLALFTTVTSETDLYSYLSDRDYIDIFYDLQDNNLEISNGIDVMWNNLNGSIDSIAGTFLEFSNNSYKLGDLYKFNKNTLEIKPTQINTDLSSIEIENTYYDILNITSVEAHLNSTGVAPFNEGIGIPEPGKDYSPDDEYVRTYDDLVYDVSVAVNGPLNEYCDVEVTMSLPEANTYTNWQYKWDINSFATGDYEVINNGETIKFYIRDLTAGQLYTKSVILKVYNAEHGKTLRPEISAKIVGTDRVVKSNTVEHAIVSGAIKPNVKMYASSNNHPTEYKGKKGRYVQFILAIASLGDISDSRKGISFPSGEFTIDVEIDVVKQNISTQEKVPIEHEVEITEYGNNLEDTSYGVKYHTGAPRNNGAPDPTSVADSGVTNIEKLYMNKYRLTINNYKITDHFPWKNPSGVSRLWQDDYSHFYSQGFSVFVPYLSDPSGSYDIYITPKVTSINYKDLDSNSFDYETNKGDNNVVMAVPEYLAGTYSVSTTFSYKNGESSGSPEWYHGNNAHMQNEELFIEIWNHYGASKDPFKGGLKSMVVFDGRKLTVNGNPSIAIKYGSNWGELKYWFGVGTITSEQAIDYKYVNTDLFEWYNNLEEAKANETSEKKISAVACDLKGWLYGNSWPLVKFRVPIVVNKDNASLNEVVTARSYSKYFMDEERLVSTNRFPISKYIPTKYDENGNVMAGTHSPMKHHGGASMLVLPYKVSVKKTVSDMVNGKPATVYNMDKTNEVNWVIQPTLSVPRDVKVIDPITIVDILPPNLNIVEESFNIPYTNIETLEDGRKKITWILEDYNSTGNLPKIHYKTTIPLLTKDRTQFDTVTTIDASGDKRSIEEFKTSKYGISIINDASFKIGKNIDKNFVEIDESFSYTLTWSNNSNKDYTNGILLDILPYNNFLDTNIHGDYVIESFSAEVGTNLFYTDVDPSTLSENPNENDSIEWKPLINGVKATAIKATVNTILRNTSQDINITLKPSNNLGGDIYNNSFKMGVTGMDAVLSSNIVKTEIINRALEGTVWYDENNNGIIDSNEKIYSEVKAHLLDDKGESVDGKVTTTNEKGYYKFDSLPIGKYQVKFELPGGTISTSVKSLETENGNHTELISDDYKTPVVTYVKDTTNKVLNCGFVESLAINKKSNSKMVYLGSEIEYTINVDNKGKTLDDRTVKVIDTLPDGLQYVEGSSNLPVNQEGNKLTWTVSNINNQSSLDINFKTKVIDISSPIVNIAYLEDAIKGVTFKPEQSNEVKVPIIEIEKISSPTEGSFVDLGDEIRYSLLIKNLSDIDAENLKVEDLLPEGTKGEDYSDTITVRSGTTETIYYTVNVNDNSEYGSIIYNTFKVNELISNKVTHTVGSPDLVFYKSMNIDEGKEVSNNTEVTYTIEVKNNGNATAKNVEIIDTLDKHLKYIPESSSYKCTTRENTLTWIIPSIAPQEVTRISFKANASREPSEGRIEVPNVSTINGVPTNKVTFVLGVPTLELEKTSVPSSGSVVYQGDTIEYTLTIKNTSDINAEGLVVKDILPQGVTGKDVTETIDISANDSKTIKVSATVDSLGKADSKELVNKFTVNDLESNEVKHIVKKPDLIYSKSMDIGEGTEVSNNTEVTYKITVENRSPGNAFDIEVTDTLHKNLTYVKDSSNIDCIESGKKLKWVIPKLAGNSKIEIIFKAIASKKPIEGEITISNLAIVNGNKTNAVSFILGVPKLELIKSSSPSSGSQVYEGDVIEYTLLIRNISDIDAEQVNVSDILPEGVIGDNVKEIINIPAHQEKTITVKTTVKEITGKSLELRNKFTSNKQQSNEVVHTVVKPNLSYEKRINIEEGSYVENCTEVEYTIVVNNTGTGVAKDIVVTDNLAENLQYIENSSSHDVKVNENRLEWNIPEIPSNSSIEIKFKALATKPESLSEVTIDNIATVNSNNTNKVSFNIGKPKLVFEKFANIENNTDVREHYPLTYYIKVKNEGTVSSKNIIIEDAIPENTEVVDVRDGTLTDNNITWVIKELLPNEEKIVSFDVIVSELPDGIFESNIRNIATVNGNETNEISHRVVKEELNIIKHSPNADEEVELGDTIDYSIKVINTGTVKANVMFKDELIESLELIEDSLDTTLNYENNVISGEIEIEPKSEIEINFSCIVKDNSKEYFENIAYIDNMHSNKVIHYIKQNNDIPTVENPPNIEEPPVKEEPEEKPTVQTSLTLRDHSITLVVLILILVNLWYFIKKLFDK